MAFQSGPFGYTGTIDELTAYRMRGVDRIVVRKKAIISRERFKKDPAFERTRQINHEWKACTMAMRAIRTPLTRSIAQLGDYNFTGALTGVCKAIQLREKVHAKGKRGVLISESPFLLEGFSFNKYTRFDQLLDHPLHYSVSRETGTAHVQLPEIVPGMNLKNPLKQPLFRFCFVLASVPDIIFNEDTKLFQPASIAAGQHQVVCTDWYTTQKGAPPRDLNCRVELPENTPGINLVLTAGIQFAQPVSHSEVNLTRYANAHKILKVV